MSTTLSFRVDYKSRNRVRINIHFGYLTILEVFYYMDDNRKLHELNDLLLDNKIIIFN